MSQEKPQTNQVPFGCWMIVGLALLGGRMFYHIAFTIAVYFLLKRLRPTANILLLTASSVFIGMSIAQTLQILVSHPELYQFHRVLEPVLLASVAFVLFLIQKRSWAWPLIIYSGLAGIILILSATFHFPKDARPKFQFSCAVVNLTMLWLLVQWLRKQTPIISAPHESGGSEIHNAETRLK
ncbi:MAG: hypothetical protein RL616_184 [Verrucomicrobiota bacterium]|jgi:peptidoglycan/LPS O-acetylase OafA/YrhL